MPAAGPVDGITVAPLFLDGSAGRLFAAHHRPTRAQDTIGHLLVVPPFNEEMNRCRSMVTQQAQALARRGLGTLVLDLHGTGDSEGDFSEARWDTWLADIALAQRWLIDQPGGCKALLGVRLGGILAAQAVNQHQAQLPVPALVIWQPVPDGKTHLTQFMRVRMAAQLDRPHLPKETTMAMRDQLARGDTLEVAGYEIHPELAEAIDKARLVDHPPSGNVAVAWLEATTGDKTEAAPASQKVIAAWQSQGAHVAHLPYAGPAFWQVHERVLAPELIARTSQWMQKALAMP
jgi:exosortase A-associated hydrolase 2